MCAAKAIKHYFIVAHVNIIHYIKARPFHVHSDSGTMHVLWREFNIVAPILGDMASSFPQILIHYIKVSLSHAHSDFGTLQVSWYRI
jgi:hypothetical protein